MDFFINIRTFSLEFKECYINKYENTGTGGNLGRNVLFTIFT